MKYEIDTAVILAAGYGRRMGELTQQRPKPLVQLSGRALIDWQIDRLKQAGIKRFFINAYYLAEQLIDHFRDDPSVEVRQEAQLLDTGGGVAAMLPDLPDQFLVINSDSLFLGDDDEYAPLLQADPANKAILLLTPINHAKGYDGGGDFSWNAPSKQENRQLNLIQRGNRFVFTGKQRLHKSVFSNLKQQCFSLNLIYDQLIHEHALYGVVFEQPWHHIGDPQAVLHAEKELNCI